MAGWGDGFSREDLPWERGHPACLLPASCRRSLSPACGQDARRSQGFRTAAESVVQPVPAMTGSRNAERLPEAPNATPFVLSVA